METISVHASIDYNILIEPGILSQCGFWAAQIFAPHAKAAIITDDNVAPLYLNLVENSLREAGFSTAVHVFPHGEDSKCQETLFDIYTFLTENQVTRTDFIVALGGGVVGDIAGFAAATYLRGIAFMQLPTTFLAAIDSSVGGKTAINIPAGKNLVGAFHQPSLVLCDTSTFATLTPEIFADGSAEMIKYGLIYSAPLFEEIEQGDITKNLESIVAQCVAIKKEVVQQDERDTGLRMILNYGHTLGHAIEKYTSHQITHGHAVAIGMVLAAKLGEKLGYGNPELTQRIIRCVQRYGLPASFAGSTADLADLVLTDKKRAGGNMRFIFVPCPGKAEIVPLAVEELRRLLLEEDMV